MAAMATRINASIADLKAGQLEALKDLKRP